MSKEKVIELIVCLIVLGGLVLSIATNVFAIDDVNQLNRTRSK